MKVFEEKLWVSIGVLLFVGVITLAFIISSKYAVDTQYSIAYRKKDALKHNLAWIPSDPFLDEDEFTLCNERSMVSYYRGRPIYKDRGRTIEEQIINEFSDCPSTPGLNGYLTVRFVINCEGELGRLRLYPLDENYKPALFPELQQRLEKYLLSLGAWKPYQNDGKSYDTITHLHCKIEDGIIRRVSR